MYIRCRAVLIFILILYLLLCHPCSAENPYLDEMVVDHTLVTEKTFNDFITSWYYKPGLTNQEYIITIQNLEDLNRETNVTSFISETNFDLNIVSNIRFDEFKPIPYNYTVDYYDFVNHSDWNETNQTYNNWTESVFNYTETIESERLDWKACKMNTLSQSNNKLKTNYGNILIPKIESKDKGDGTFNGTKIFKMTFNTPIINTPDGFGSVGRVALFLDGVEFCPYWNTSWSAYSTVTMNATAPENNFQVLLSPDDFAIPLNMWNEMNQDGNDTRILNNNHTIEFPFRIEHLTARDDYKIWVNVTDNASATYQWYYGNDAADGVSNGDDTFLFFDDFLGSSLDSTKWDNIGSVGITVSNSIIELNNFGYDTGRTILSKSTYGNFDNFIFETKAKVAGAAGVDEVCVLPRATDPSVSENAYYFSWYATSVISIARFINGAYTSLDSDSSPPSNWAIMKGVLNSSDLEMFQDGVSLLSASDVSHSTGRIGLGGGGSGRTGQYDWFFIRKYTANEPIITSISEPHYYANSLYYNASFPYNITVESDGTLTANQSITTTDDTNWTAYSTGTTYWIFTSAVTPSGYSNFTISNDNLNNFTATNLTASTLYNLENSSGTVEGQTTDSDGAAIFEVDLVAGDYWVVAAATTTGYTVSGTIYGAAGLGEGQVLVTLGSDSTTTSPCGSYSFTSIPTGTYTLTASKPGLQDVSTTITVSSDTTQDLTMALAVSPGGGGQQSSDWVLPFNISTPISRLDGLFTPLQVPSDPGKINLFWYCILGFGAFMFVDGTAFHFDKSRNNPVIKLKYRISAPLSLTLVFLGLLYIGLINWNSTFFINTLDWLHISSITQPAIFGTGILLLGVFVFIDGTTFHFDKSRNNPVIKLKYRISAPLSLILIFIGLLYTGMINWNSVFFIRVFDWPALSSITGAAMLGTVILLLGILAFIDGLAFCFDKSRKSTLLKIKYQVLIAAGLGLGILGAVISKLLIFS